MRKVLFVVAPVLLFGSAAMAQGKIDTKWHCSKASAEQKMDVGDMPGHMYAIAQGTCDATSSDPGFAEKTGAGTEYQDNTKTSMTSHGQFMVTMDNGDKVHYSYTDTGSADTTKPMSNKWSIVSGTGKQKGIKGSGTCSGTANADGSSDWTCTGTYTMAMGKMDSKDKMKM
jgi:hypothetical protein